VDLESKQLLHAARLDRVLASELEQPDLTSGAISVQAERVGQDAQLRVITLPKGGGKWLSSNGLEDISPSNILWTKRIVIARCKREERDDRPGEASGPTVKQRHHPEVKEGWTPRDADLTEGIVVTGARNAPASVS
jgi:hypothetical protein